MVPPDGRTAARPEADLARVVAALRSVVPLVAAVARVIRTLALVAFGCAAVIVAAVLAHGLPSSATKIVLMLVLVAVLAAPGTILFLFYFALGELLELPGRIRSLPRTAGEHVGELLRLERETRASRRTGGWMRAPLVLWRLVDFLRSSTWILRPYAPVAAVLSPAFLVAVALSAFAALLLVPIAIVAVVVSALA